MFYTIKGRVTSSSNAPVRRRLFAYNRETGALIDSTYSSITTGEYELRAFAPNPVMVICQPNSGETLNALVYDNVTPIQVANDTPTGIGTPGSAGFGVGVAPTLPTGVAPMDGYNNPYHENYGNYEFTDGSIMVFVPAFYVKWGDGTNGLAVNKVMVKDYSAYPDDTAAAADGYVIHRAFIDGGLVKSGFFLDKYVNAKHPTLNVISSIRLARMISANDANLAVLGVSNNVAGLCDATKLRGAGFHAATAFAHNAIQVLSLCHGQNSTSNQYCAWFGATNNFPRGNDNNTAIGYSLKDTTLKGYRDTNPGNSNMQRAGSCSTVAAVSHNGQACGVMDTAGGAEEMSIGFTIIGGDYKFQKESVTTRNIIVSALVADPNSFINPVNYESMGTTLPGSAPSASVRYRSNTAINYPNNTDRTSVAYRMNMLGIPTGALGSTDEPNPIFGGAVYHNKVTNCLIGIGLSVSNGAAAGPWGMSTGPYTTLTDYNSCVRSMIFP